MDVDQPVSSQFPSHEVQKEIDGSFLMDYEDII